MKQCPHSDIIRLMIIIGIALLLPRAAIAQDGRVDPVREKDFAFQVKVMDEFIERFNDNPATVLRKYVAETTPGVRFGRKEMIYTLFNRPESWTGNVLAKSFMRQVMDPAHPQGLRFNDSNWYAEAFCVFNVDGRNTEIPLILQIQPGQTSGIRWVITGIGDSYIFRNAPPEPRTLGTAKAAPGKALQPSAYATNFLAFYEVFKPGMDEGGYFSAQLLKTERGRQFISLVKQGAITFAYTGVTRFHIFQIPGYALLVEHFVRQGINSGWLISDIQPVNEQELTVRKAKLLQRSL